VLLNVGGIRTSNRERRRKRLGLVCNEVISVNIASPAALVRARRRREFGDDQCPEHWRHHHSSHHRAGGTVSSGARLVPHSAELLDENRHWLAPKALGRDGRLVLCFQSYVVRTPHHTVLVDSCIGNDKVRSTRPEWNLKRGATFMRALAAAGFGVDDIDFVMCTHMHIDHVGWNTRMLDGRWTPTFSKARYLFSKGEFDYWAEQHARTPAPPFGDSMLPVMEAGQAELVCDIISDEAPMLAGSIGMLGSAALGANNKGLFEPSGGSAPDIAGKDIANPIAMIMSAAMILRYSVDRPKYAARIENAVKKVLKSGLRTGDICQEGCQRVGTRAMGDAVLRAL
jgi:hypothetical protein